ncbi:LysR family transcriptional regulator [Tatumella morbirosei]|uniref:LysR family transcriptional regulator n=1 Tax=Tatumella morbirosei TaxID=642227 RepID=A0A095VBW6_9GAMM|nr:LysR family transcriptional regulator [Tatumella morbirosei]KGD72165.1 LysR family transcriptional regulator [Tatumella morbirosei]
MNHTSLKIFTVVAEELSIIKAAKRLGRVQSNITTRIQQLEQELDVQLFLRDNKKLQLSPEGETFLSYCRQLLTLADEARQALHPQHPSGVLRLGSMESTVASRLNQPLSDFSRAFPEVHLQLVTLPTRQLTEAVLSRELDCALVSLPVDRQQQTECPAGLNFRSLFSEDLLMVYPAGYQPDCQEPLPLAAFAEGCSYRRIAVQALQAQTSGGPLPAISEVSSYHSMLSSVAGGGYCCLLPASVFGLLQPARELTIIPAGIAVTQFIWRDHSISLAVQNLGALLAREVAD